MFFKERKIIKMKKVFALVLSVTFLCFMVGCGAVDTSEPQPKDTYITVTDDLGQQVTLEQPQRTAVLIGSFADVWCLAGGKDSLVAAADDTWTQFDLDLPDDVVHLGGVKTPNLEKLLASQPDLVIGSTKTAADLEINETLKQMGIPMLCFDVSNFEDYLRMLDICTQLTGHPENYTKYGADIKVQVDAARARVQGKPPRVLYVRASGSSCKVKNSKGSVLGEMLADLGCENIADSEQGLLENLSMETILATDPDYIFAVLQGSDGEKAQQSLQEALLSNPAWESLTAVKENRFYIMDQTLYNLKPNARWGEAYENLADILYPES